jgi:hypothetical protein
MCLGGTLSQFGVNARTIADEKTAQGAIHADEQVNRAILDSEGGALKALLTDDFIYINSSGALLDRDKYLQDLRFTQFESFTPHEVKARIYGDTVVLTARLFANWRKQGGDGSGRFRYARVYIWHQDRWQLASSQLTPMNE